MFSFSVRSFLYLLSILALTVSIVVAVSAEHPMAYNTMINCFRGSAEIFTCLVAFHTLLIEMNQFKR